MFVDGDDWLADCALKDFSENIDGDEDLIISKLSNKFNNILFPENSKNFACSISIAKSAYNRYKNGEFGYSNSLVPLYLRPSQAERNIKG